MAVRIELKGRLTACTSEAAIEIRGIVRLKTSDSRSHIIEYLEEGCKTGQFQGSHDSLRHPGQDNLTSVVTFAVSLTYQ
jgi:hypothetical protein